MITNCKNCDYWDPFAPDKTIGRCRKKPPVFIPETSTFRWPITDSEVDWCGSGWDVVAEREAAKAAKLKG